MVLKERKSVAFASIRTPNRSAPIQLATPKALSRLLLTLSCKIVIESVLFYFYYQHHFVPGCFVAVWVCLLMVCQSLKWNELNCWCSFPLSARLDSTNRKALSLSVTLIQEFTWLLRAIFVGSLSRKKWYVLKIVSRLLRSPGAAALCSSIAARKLIFHLLCMTFYLH